MRLQDIARLAPLNIIGSMQPTHGTDDMRWAVDRIGPQRLQGAYAWKSVLNATGLIALGSDFPVSAAQYSAWMLFFEVVAEVSGCRSKFRIHFWDFTRR